MAQGKKTHENQGADQNDKERKKEILAFTVAAYQLALPLVLSLLITGGLVVFLLLYFF